MESISLLTKNLLKRQMITPLQKQSERFSLLQLFAFFILTTPVRLKLLLQFDSLTRKFWKKCEQILEKGTEPIHFISFEL